MAKTDLVIIGGGYSGTLAAIEALRLSRRFGHIREIVLVEKTKAQEQGGVAYSSVTAKAFHETNIAAKNMGLTKEETARIADFLQIDARKVMKRPLVQTFLKAALDDAQVRRPGEHQPARIRRVSAEAVDLVEHDNDVVVKFKGQQKNLKAERVIVATGSLQQRQLPCVTEELLDNDVFRDHFVVNQWKPEGQFKIAGIPHDKPVLIVGTALSAYDAARSLLRQGHTGQIVLMSRHGLEHFKYPENHEWPDITLPEPQFVRDILAGNWTRAQKSAEKEFYDLTSLKVDLAKGTITPDSKWQAAFSGRQSYLPEQVLKQWEKNLKKIADVVGKDRVGRFMEKYMSLISVLRVGAGNSICNEIEAAKARGQLSVVAADITGMQPAEDGDGITIKFTRRDEDAKQTETFHTVISSLGPDHNYTRTTNPLWRNILRRHFTEASETRIGVDVSMNAGDFGRLPHSKRIYGAGIPAAGENMIESGLIGPPVFSVPGMREGVRKTADAAVAAILQQRIPGFAL